MAFTVTIFCSVIAWFFGGKMRVAEPPIADCRGEIKFSLLSRLAGQGDEPHCLSCASSCEDERDPSGSS